MFASVGLVAMRCRHSHRGARSSQRTHQDNAGRNVQAEFQNPLSRYARLVKIPWVGSLVEAGKSASKKTFRFSCSFLTEISPPVGAEAAPCG